MAYAKDKLEAMSVEAPFPAEVEVEEEAVPLFVDVEEDWLLPPVVLAVLTLLEPELAVAIDLLAVEVGDTLEESVTLAHERSYNGDVLKVLSLVLLPRRPKLGFGAVGAASCRTYHQVLTLSKADAHPT